MCLGRSYGLSGEECDLATLSGRKIGLSLSLVLSAGRMLSKGPDYLKTLTNTHFGQNVNLTDVDCDWCVQTEQQGATHAGPGPFESLSKVFSLSWLTETF